MQAKYGKNWQVKFMWGDAGDLFFVIRKRDLAQRNFNNVFVTLESS